MMAAAAAAAAGRAAGVTPAPAAHAISKHRDGVADLHHLTAPCTRARTACLRNAHGRLQPAGSCPPSPRPAPAISNLKKAAAAALSTVPTVDTVLLDLVV
jgi:hypothetical protein